MILAFDLVGWGTLALALATAVMAVVTWSVSKQTARAATAAEKELEEGHLLLKASLDQVAASQAQASAGQAQVDASLEQARAAKEALSLSVRPLLVPASGLEDFDRSARRVFEANGLAGNIYPPAVALWTRTSHANTVTIEWVVVKLSNIGNGPAIIDNRPDRLFLRTMLGGNIPGSVTSLVVPAGGFVFIAFADTRPSDDPVSLASMLSIAEKQPGYVQQLRLVVTYADVSRDQWSVSRLTFHPSDENKLDLIGVEFEAAPTATP